MLSGTDHFWPSLVIVFVNFGTAGFQEDIVVEKKLIEVFTSHAAVENYEKFVSKNQNDSNLVENCDYIATVEP